MKREEQIRQSGEPKEAVLAVMNELAKQTERENEQLNYKKLYEEAIERAKFVLSTDLTYEGAWAVEHIFPEIRDSKSESSVEHENKTQFTESENVKQHT